MPAKKIKKVRDYKITAIFAMAIAVIIFVSFFLSATGYYTTYLAQVICQGNASGLDMVIAWSHPFNITDALSSALFNDVTGAELAQHYYIYAGPTGTTGSVGMAYTVSVFVLLNTLVGIAYGVLGLLVLLKKVNGKVLVYASIGLCVFGIVTFSIVCSLNSCFNALVSMGYHFQVGIGAVFAFVCGLLSLGTFALRGR